MPSAAILKYDNRETSDLSDTDLDLVTGGGHPHHGGGGHNGADVFTWGLIGGVAVVVGSVIIIGLL
jgi:hypothetical protein